MRGTVYLSTLPHAHEFPDNEFPVAEATRFDRFSKNDGRLVSRFKRDNNATAFRDLLHAVVAKFLSRVREERLLSREKPRRA